MPLETVFKIYEYKVTYHVLKNRSTPISGCERGK